MLDAEKLQKMAQALVDKLQGNIKHVQGAIEGVQLFYQQLQSELTAEAGTPPMDAEPLNVGE